MTYFQDREQAERRDEERRKILLLKIRAGSNFASAMFFHDYVIKPKGSKQ